MTTRALYDAARLDVRSGLDDAHRAALEHFARPGTWWSAEERVAIVEEGRNALACKLCEDRKQALSPYGQNGSHDGLGVLDEPVIKVIHRIRTDSGRLTKSWFDGVMRQGMSPGAYVELVGVVSVGVIVDTFTESLGLEFVELPPSVAGEPSREHHDQAIEDGAWVPISKLQPQVRANIVRALGLVPSEQQNFWQVFRHHYLSSDGRAIAQAQIELVASRTSALNQCFY